MRPTDARCWRLELQQCTFEILVLDGLVSEYYCYQHGAGEESEPEDDPLVLAERFLNLHKGND